MPNEGEQEQPKYHTWNLRLERGANPTQHEFGNAVTKREAAQRIAQQMGLRELPSSAVLSNRHLEPLEPLEPTPPQEDKEEDAQDAESKPSKRKQT